MNSLFDELFNEFWPDFWPRFLARFLTRFLAGVLTKVFDPQIQCAVLLGRRNTVYSTTRTEKTNYLAVAILAQVGFVACHQVGLSPAGSAQVHAWRVSHPHRILHPSRIASAMVA